MMMEVYMMTLLTLCLVALVLALVLLMQGASNQFAQPTLERQQVYSTTAYASDTTTAHLPPRQAKPREALNSNARRANTAPSAHLMIAGPRNLTEAEQLSLIISGFSHIRLNGSNASRLLADRTLPRLKENTAKISERLHMGRHRLQLIELSEDMKSAAIASQVMRQLPRFEAHA